jgi:hypothetical protein
LECEYPAEEVVDHMHRSNPLEGYDEALTLIVGKTRYLIIQIQNKGTEKMKIFDYFEGRCTF